MKSVGIDIVENERIKKVLNETFLNYLLSEDEIKIYRKYSGERAVQFVAGRFAAKEAVIKALAGETPVERKEIVVLNNEDGSPYVQLKDYILKISISHEKNYAVAIAVWL